MSHNIFNIMMRKHCFYLTFFFLFFLNFPLLAQNCTVNAGGNFTSCSNSITLSGTRSSNFSGSSIWSLVNFIPSQGGSVSTDNVTIVSPTSLITNVVGLNTSGVYTFRLTQPCSSDGNAVSDVEVTIFANTGFTAGPDVSAICSSIGTVDLTGAFIPPGFTGTWTIENTFKRLRYGEGVNTNSQLSSTTIENPVFSLLNKINHPEDPTYTLILTITSLDNSCSYSDSRQVAFCPNPNIEIPTSVVKNCTDLTGNEFIQLTFGPIWATNTAGFNSSGLLTLNVITQPSGANMQLSKVETFSGNTAISTADFTGMTELGTYTYTLSATSCCSSFTSEIKTITLSAKNPDNINLTPIGHSEQLQGWLGASGSVKAGEINCNLAGTTSSECFYFDIDSSDPIDIPISIYNGFLNTILPTGASIPTFTITRGVEGFPRRVEVCVNPGAVGWLAGSYFFGIIYGEAPCVKNDGYVIHVSDNAREDLFVPNQSICFSGTGSTTATINLPSQFIETLTNPAYFQLSGSTLRYEFLTLSKPVGSDNPTFAAPEDRQLVDASTTIYNLNTAGEYRFRMTIYNGNGSANYINRDFLCSDASDTVEFSVFVETIQAANAGSTQSFACSNLTTLLGNVPSGTNTGLWQLVSKPLGANDPILGDAANPTTTLDGINALGDYTYSWTITSPSGICTNSDTATLTVQALAPVVSNITPTEIVNGTDGTITIEASGGAGVLTYTITNALFTSTNDTGIFLNLAPGLYNITVSDGTCTSNVIQAQVDVDECNAVLSGYADADGDGVSDICDLDQDNDGILNLEELTSNIQGINVAQLGTVSQSSTEGTYLASFATDGNLNTFSTTTELTSNEYLDIDLGRNYMIDHINFLSDLNCNYCGSTYIFISNNPFTTADTDLQASFNNAIYTYYVGEYITEDILTSINTVGRYVRVQKADENGNLERLLIREIEIYTKFDEDADGVLSSIDTDSDNDGIPDAIEAFPSLTSNQLDVHGRLVGGVDLNGVPLIANGGFIPVDTDNDGIPNYKDIDSDNDGIVDIIESQSTTSYVTILGVDTDRDGIDNAFDVDSGGFLTIVLFNTDGADVPDMLDLDSDNDGISDEAEATQGIFASGDSDNDGLADIFDEVNFFVNLVANTTNGLQTATTPFPDTDSPGGEPNWRNSVCVNLPHDGLATSFGTIGISSHSSKQESWPSNVPNAVIVLESSTKGFVITRISTAARDASGFVPVEGMLIYNTTVNRFQLRKADAWVNLKRGCIN